jgi:hypothetical protein
MKMTTAVRFLKDILILILEFRPHDRGLKVVNFKNARSLGPGISNYFSGNDFISPFSLINSTEEIFADNGIKRADCDKKDVA